jgi:hypothetical protein
MTFTVAVVVDPWIAHFWQDQNYMAYLRAEFQKLPVVSHFRTATARHLDYRMSSLWDSTAGWNYTTNLPNPPNSIHDKALTKNFIIMSNKIDTTTFNKKTQTYTTTPVPGARLVAHKDGLININAENDAIDRMFSTKPKPDLVVIIDPEHLLSGPNAGSSSAHTLSTAIYHGHYTAQQMGLNILVL